MLVLAGLLSLFPTPPGATPPVTCEITAPATAELGKAPAIKVALTNRTRATIVLAGSLDGSDCKWRFPYCHFEVSGPDGRPEPFARGRCKLVNPVREKDFVRVPAGKSFDPYQKVDDYGFFGDDQIGPELFAVPGEYRVRFVYSTEGWAPGASPKSMADAGASEAIQELIGQVSKVTVVSNEITVKVVEPARK